jgi:uncharacterized DUF497 family protein
MQPEYEWDEDKRISNLKKHALDFQDIIHFVWDNALISEDQSESYGEMRYRALGLINQQLVMLVFTLRGECVRVISLRKATRQEKQHYGN